MIFSLSPTSGHANSCLDVFFTVTVENSKNLEIEIFNDTEKQQLEILSTSTGHIENEKRIIANSSPVSGHINLFNRDKMNELLNKYNSVDIRCKVKFGNRKEESTVTFYNESKPLDADIIPFDVIVDNREVDIKNNIPLSLHIICDIEKKYELSIRSLDGKNSCVFEVITKRGRVDVKLPSEILWSDLQLVNGNKKYQLYWTKFEGITHMRFMNRKYIPISDSRIVFNSEHMKPLPQKREGPIGNLSQDFVISHRYFVHTWKDYTAFRSKIFNWDHNAKRTLQYIHESQDLQRNNTVSVMSNKKRTQPKISSRTDSDPRQRLLIDAYKSAFTKKQKQIYSPRNVDTFSSHPISHSPQKKGCGCSRA